jgi:hypothetical protein
MSYEDRFVPKLISVLDGFQWNKFCVLDIEIQQIIMMVIFNNPIIQSDVMYKLKGYSRK